MMSDDRTRSFISAIVEAAIYDVEQGIPEYDKRNSGERLLSRLDLARFRTSPRNGDGKYARSLYTAAHWLYRTERER